MMRYVSLLHILFFTFQSHLEAQSELNISFFGDVMINANSAEHRVTAAEIFYDKFSEKYVQNNSTEFDELENKYISVLRDENNSIHLVSWQVDAGEGVFLYHAFLFRQNQKVVEFLQNTDLNKESAYNTLRPSEWYGALYYNIIPLENNKFIVFGFNGNGIYNNTKTADILDLNNGEVKLGAEYFEDKEDLGTMINRLVITYSSDASVNLNYNPGLEMIVHDHLQPRMGKQAGQGPTYFPDGTYEGYELKDGYWKYNEKIFDHQYGENNAPRPKPVLDGVKKSIFGK